MHFISEMEVGSGDWAGAGLKTLKLRKWLMTFKIIIAVREAIRSRTKGWQWFSTAVLLHNKITDKNSLKYFPWKCIRS